MQLKQFDSHVYVEHTKIILSHFIQKYPNTNYPPIYSKYFKCLQCLHIEISNKNIFEEKN